MSVGTAAIFFIENLMRYDMALPYALRLLESLLSKFDKSTGQINTALVADMQGATEHSAGAHGLVPAPSQEDRNRPLGGNGEYLTEADIDINGTAARAIGDEHGNSLSTTYAKLEDVMPEQDLTELFNKTLLGE